jgi:hypothetical protein
MLVGTGAAALTLSQFPFGWRADAQDKKRRILFFTKSSGFEHSVIKRQGDQLGHAEKVLTELGEKHGFEVTCTKDGGVFTAENLAKYDAYFFYTTGDLTQAGADKNPPMSPEGKATLLEAVKNGKGFLGSHCGSDTFHSPGDRRLNNENVDPYIAMLGGEFISHGAQQKAKMMVTDTKFPGCQDLKDFELLEEWYSLKNFAKDLRVLLVQETMGMNGKDYERPPFPATWARMHGKGRVFYTSMGHREDVWTNPTFQQILLGGIAWAVGNVRADVKPNIEQVAPQCHVMPPK